MEKELASTYICVSLTEAQLQSLSKIGDAHKFCSAETVVKIIN